MISAGQARRMSLAARLDKPDEDSKLSEIEALIKRQIHRHRGKVSRITVDYIVNDVDYKVLIDQGYKVIRGYWQEDINKKFTSISW
jgi:hypothetical protein